MRDCKVGDRIQVKLSGARMVQVTIKAGLETTSKDLTDCEQINVGGAHLRRM
jgi:hypothetical protein